MYLEVCFRAFGISSMLCLLKLKGAGGTRMHALDHGLRLWKDRRFRSSAEVWKAAPPSVVERVPVVVHKALALVQRI